METSLQKGNAEKKVFQFLEIQDLKGRFFLDYLERLFGIMHICHYIVSLVCSCFRKGFQ